MQQLPHSSITFNEILISFFTKSRPNAKVMGEYIAIKKEMTMSKLIVGLMLVLINCNVIAKNLTIKCESESLGFGPNKMFLRINVDEDNNKLYVSGPPIFDVMISPDIIYFSQLYASSPVTTIIDRVSGTFRASTNSPYGNTDVLMSKGNCTKVITPERKF